MIYRYDRPPYHITTARDALDLHAVHAYLSTSYWAAGISRDLVARSVAHSLCFGLFTGAKQIGFARVVTDAATFAYLADVYVLEDYRGQGLGKWLMETIVSHPDVQGLRRWLLATRDAHGLYAQYGFVPLDNPDGFMQRQDIVAYNVRTDPTQGNRIEIGSAAEASVSAPLCSRLSLDRRHRHRRNRG